MPYLGYGGDSIKKVRDVGINVLWYLQACETLPKTIVTPTLRIATDRARRCPFYRCSGFG